MTNITKSLDTLAAATSAANSALSIADKVAGLAGRGGPRWHRWRALRLRLRAVNAERRGDKTKAYAMRVRAGLHIEAAIDSEQRVPDEAEYQAMKTLLFGDEPLLVI